LATPRKEPVPGQRDTVLHQEFREDLRYWVETERRTALRVLALVEAILCDPFRGLLPGSWQTGTAEVSWRRRVVAPADPGASHCTGCNGFC
jgi:Txe/YoeB family toxin of Txe-Axe toxin-antitoxin module